MRTTLFALFLTVAAAPFLVAAPPAASAAPPANWAEGYVVANGIRIHYWRTGGAPAKPALVMAHGSSDDGLCWTNLAKEFTQSYDIILFDARGHGLSDPPKPGDPVDVQVEDLAGLIGELKLDKPILMGHSMGSASVAWFAAKYPTVARAIVLEDPALVRRANTPAANTASPEKRRADTLMRNNTSLEDLVAGCMKGSPKWGQSECELWAPSKRRHHPDTANVNNANRPAMKDLFAKIAVPTLILKADAEGELRQQNEAVTAVLAHGKIVHIAGAGHNVRRENKPQTLEVLSAFLASLR